MRVILRFFILLFKRELPVLLLTTGDVVLVNMKCVRQTPKQSSYWSNVNTFFRWSFLFFRKPLPVKLLLPGDVILIDVDNHHRPFDYCWGTSKRNMTSTSMKNIKVVTVINTHVMNVTDLRCDLVRPQATAIQTIERGEVRTSTNSRFLLLELL